MAHEVSETDVESRREGEVEPTPLRPPPEGADAASTTGRVDATAAEAREVAEAARETDWSRPSFAKELYLGRFDLSLIHPHPRGEADDAARGEEFLARLREYCETLDGSGSSARTAIPDDYLKGLRRSARSA